MSQHQDVLVDKAVLLEANAEVTIAVQMTASEEDANEVIMSHNRSDWTWIRLANGDLVLATYPHGDLYDKMSQRNGMV